ncbi:hypothetical protein GF325_10800 [Candidatus Bathyarchaeota archaeon]|nr:hypothetical protein [Candidatus Bathyarchaeota archaeon]
MKKIVLGDYLFQFIEGYFEGPGGYSSLEIVMLLSLYSIYIYADFSGYTSIVRGLAKLMGIDLVQNFNQPYLSSSPRNFWNRWHISLSNWLRDYVYIPLGGNRKGKRRTYMNLLMTMFIGGLWHGATPVYIIWGLLHGTYLAGHRWYIKRDGMRVSREGQSSRKEDIKKILSTILTFSLITIAWIFFPPPSHASRWTLGDSFVTLQRLFSFTFEISFNMYNVPKVLIFSSIFLFVIDYTQRKMKKHEIFEDMHWVVRGLCLTGVFILILFFFKNYAEVPFVYEGF